MNIFNRFNRFFLKEGIETMHLRKSIKEDTIWDDGLSKSWHISAKYSFLKDLDGCFSRRHFSSPDGTISEIDCASYLSRCLSRP